MSFGDFISGCQRILKCQNGSNMTNRGSGAGMRDIIAWVSFLVSSHFLANIVYHDIKAIWRDFIRHFQSNWSLQKSVEVSRESVEVSRESVESQQKSVESQQKSVESQQKSVESHKKLVESQQKSKTFITATYSTFARPERRRREGRRKENANA